MALPLSALPRPYYDDGSRQIYHGDALETIEELRGSFDAIVADPPYSSGTRQANDRGASNIPKRGEKWSRSGIVWDTSFSSYGLSRYLNLVLRNSREILDPGAHVYLFTDWRQYPVFVESVEWSGLFLNNMLVWDKGMYALGGNWRSQHELIVFASNGPARELASHDRGNVLYAKRSTGEEHPTEKPIDLILQLLVASGAKSVLDPFMGSGTTLRAAKDLGLRAVGIEIEERYCEIAAARLSQEVLPLEGLA